MKTQATLVASASQSGEQRIEIAEKEFIEPPLELISRIIHSFDGIQDFFSGSDKILTGIRRFRRKWKLSREWNGRISRWKYIHRKF